METFLNKVSSSRPTTTLKNGFIAVIFLSILRNLLEQPSYRRTPSNCFWPLFAELAPGNQNIFREYNKDTGTIN